MRHAFSTILFLFVSLECGNLLLQTKSIFINVSDVHADFNMIEGTQGKPYDGK